MKGVCGGRDKFEGEPFTPGSCCHPGPAHSNSSPHFSPLARFSPDLGVQDLRRSRCADPKGSPYVIDGALSGDASTKTRCSSCADRTSDATSYGVQRVSCRSARLARKAGQGVDEDWESVVQERVRWEIPARLVERIGRTDPE